MEALSAYFSEVIITCPFTTCKIDSVYTTYKAAHIKFIPLPIVGGDTIKQKLKILTAFPKWFKTYKQLGYWADIVYMRLPDNVSLPAFFYYLFKRKSAFITYTGTWDNYKGEALTWRLEKWLLRNVFKGPCWVYTNKPLTLNHFHKGISPSYNRNYWHSQTMLVEKKKNDFYNGKEVLRFITVGALVPHKNQVAIIEACKLLKEKQQLFELTIVGGGPLFKLYKQKIEELGLEKEVVLAGKKTRNELAELFIEADFVIQMPYQEPYGKVPIEGWFYGLIPILSNVGVSEAFTGDGKFGYLCSPADIQKLAEIMHSLYINQQRFVDMIDAGRMFAFHNTLEDWAEQYNSVITSTYVRTN